MIVVALEALGSAKYFLSHKICLLYTQTLTVEAVFVLVEFEIDKLAGRGGAATISSRSFLAHAPDPLISIAPPPRRFPCGASPVASGK